jgi:outer membrane protein assembly factor BamB
MLTLTDGGLSGSGVEQSLRIDGNSRVRGVAPTAAASYRYAPLGSVRSHVLSKSASTGCRLTKSATCGTGGAIVTAGGLVFCSGTRDHKIRAFDKDTGVELWSAKLPWVGNAPPASYEVNGRQYIVIAATGANKLGTPYGDAYVAFALPRGGQN